MKKPKYLWLWVAMFSWWTLLPQHFLLSAEKEPTAKPKKSWREYFMGSSEKKHPKEKTKKSAEPTALSGRTSMDRKSSGDREELNPEGMVDLVDAPTSNVIDYGGYRLNFRLYSKGGLLTHLSFGVFQRLNIGASWDNEEVIGSENPHSNAPTLNVKFRVYDGGEVLPSFAIGYDGQERFFDKIKDDYSERERGLFGVFGREIFFPKLEFYGGINSGKFKDGTVQGFIGLSYTIEQRLVILMEYDNIRTGAGKRFNAGIRVFPIPSLGIDFAFRRIGSSEDKERIVRINYVGSF